LLDEDIVVLKPLLLMVLVIAVVVELGIHYRLGSVLTIVCAGSLGIEAALLMTRGSRNGRKSTPTRTM
jgi:hypothetical protein